MNSQRKTGKGDAIPAKFEPIEEALLRQINKDSGLSVSEIIRRSVRILYWEVQARGGDTKFIMDLCPIEEEGDEAAATAGSGVHFVPLVMAEGMSKFKNGKAAKKHPVEN